MSGSWFEVVAASIGTGVLSSVGTVAALRIHIQYLREHNVVQDTRMDHLEKRVSIVEQSAQRAHVRIDIREARENNVCNGQT